MVSDYTYLSSGRSRRLLIIGGLTVLATYAGACSNLISRGRVKLSDYAISLANHLTQTGATMYGAFWCPHCKAQKALFEEAANLLLYVECDPQGENPNPQLCQAKNIRGYPTWEIGGELYVGIRSLDELAALSNFPAP